MSVGYPTLTTTGAWVPRHRGGSRPSPAAAGWLVNAVGAPLAVLADALSFLVAAVMLAGLRAPEPANRPERRGATAEIAEGVVTVWRDRVLRAMVIVTTIASFGGAIGGTVFVLFAVRHVGVSAPVLGIVFACGSVAGLAGAMLAGRISRRLTPGGAMVAGQATYVAGALLIIAAPPGPAGAAVLGVVQVLLVGGLAVFSVTQIALRQAITPTFLLGRVNATRRVAVFGIIPVGALLGGYLGSALGLHAALIVAASVEVVAIVVMVASPLRTARESVSVG